MFHKLFIYSLLYVLINVCLVQSSEKCAEGDVECHERLKYTRGILIINKCFCREKRQKILIFQRKTSRVYHQSGRNITI